MRMTIRAFRTAALAALAVLSSAFATPADETGADDARAAVAAEAEERMETLRERLELTDEQAAALEPIVADNIERRRVLLEEAGIEPGGERPSRREMKKLRDGLNALRKETEPKIAEILTAEQMAEYRAFQDETKSEMREAIKARRGG